MTTTINDVGDLARIIREQPEWADTLRGLLLGQEVLDLPQRLSQFAELTSQNFQLAHTRQEAESLERQAGGSRLEARLNRVDGKLDNAVGANYENKVGRICRGLLGQQLGLTRVSVLYGAEARPDFLELIYQAEEDGILTLGQVSQLLQSDLICVGRYRADPARLYLVAEASVTIGDNDVERARERADILSLVVDAPVQAVIIGAYIDAARTNLAAEKGVKFLSSPEEY